MTEQRHRIRRQVLEVTIADRDTARQLQPELARIQEQVLAPILDRCLTELGAPDHVQRIDKLELDLGQVDLHDLAQDLARKLEPSLRKMLARQLEKQESIRNSAASDGEVESRLALLVLFLHGGTVPWWADSTQPRLIDQTVEYLLAKAARSLVLCLQPLVRDRGRLLRLILHCADERLMAVLGELLALSRPRLAPRLGEQKAALRALLEARAAIPRATAEAFREAIFLGLLRAAGSADSSGSQIDLWREALGLVALELGVPYRALLAGLREERALVETVQALEEELLGEAAQRVRAAREAVDEIRPSPSLSPDVESGRLAALTAADQTPLASPDDLSLPRSEPRLLRSGHSGIFMQERPLPDGRGSDREEEEAIGSLLARLAQWDTPLRELFGELAIQVERLPEAEQAALREPLVELLQQDPPNLTTAASSAALQHLLRQVAAMGLLSGEPAARSQAALTQPSPRLHPARLRQPSADKAWPQRPPAAPTELPTDALSYADSDEVYVENAGLVLLWPFLSSLYTRLELLTDNRFQDDEARHRAVGLLQHLATGELEPQEYTLPLAKLLCGMDHSEVFHFGPPITPAETAECTDLLSSAIASAEVLGDMSLAGFREALLLRKGVLSARDGVWLLRVERTTYDLVLDQIPWPLSWIKLPWMETPLCVEW